MKTEDLLIYACHSPTRKRIARKIFEFIKKASKNVICNIILTFKSTYTMIDDPKCIALRYIKTWIYL